MLSVFTVATFALLIIFAVFLLAGGKESRKPKTALIVGHFLVLFLSSFAYNAFTYTRNENFVDWKSLFAPNTKETSKLVVHYFYLFTIAIVVIQAVLYKFGAGRSVFFQKVISQPIDLFMWFLFSIFAVTLVLRFFFFQFSEWEWFPLVVVATLLPFHIVGFFQSFLNPKTTIKFQFDPQNRIYSKRMRRITKPTFGNLFCRKQDVEQPLLGHKTKSKKKTKKQKETKKEIQDFGAAKKLRLIQLTDIHMGVWMNEKRLTKISEWVVSEKPDLVLLTGDYLTMDTNNAEGCEELQNGLAPLNKLEGRVFACLGNHDYEYLDGVKEVFSNLKIPLLEDEQSLVDLQKKNLRIQVIGAAYNFDAKKPVENLIKKFPRRDDADLRLILLHRPVDFVFIPNEDQSIVLSGHTHGGLLGLNFLGIKRSIMAPFYPDQGWYGKGRNAMYVHRGTGFYGQTRMGVSGEQSILELEFKSTRTDFYEHNDERNYSTPSSSSSPLELED
ncbi:transmembrane protein with metallophosphoesterase domain-related [Anaeramoeba flamelloides]|uniref:Transmembrane protein with metallophosphoesterase domain-related n=1 Tax=Anaeramoeba flamelloides TaxID=1746091 RepID=A0ABQ8YHH2_9EUKA|nr:transmembrane protein with metallophosphoesterase domain-related [Anaeramoeba flamelloides]